MVLHSDETLGTEEFLKIQEVASFNGNVTANFLLWKLITR